MKMGFKNDGTPVACQAHFTSYKGAYYTHGSGVAFTTGSWLIGMYKFGAVNYKGDTLLHEYRLPAALSVVTATPRRTSPWSRWSTRCARSWVSIRSSGV